MTLKQIVIQLFAKNKFIAILILFFFPLFFSEVQESGLFWFIIAIGSSAIELVNPVNIYLVLSPDVNDKFLQGDKIRVFRLNGSIRIINVGTLRKIKGTNLANKICKKILNSFIIGYLLYYLAIYVWVLYS